ncbi:hypothetical protein [Streptomyces sp. WAC01526]|uniref:hypothetical protein n=1 Tax=Streptomyces sp. WAC01526 TaxID=2588709 RepID=UPI0011DF06A3|nr:hypothetical protein [Streptomyces sp. WAC01526]
MTITNLLLKRAIPLVMVSALLTVAAAVPAAADTSSCTHHFTGPQVCIRLEGRNHLNSATAIWTNPSPGTKHRKVTLFVKGRRFSTVQAHRVGDTLSHTWGTFDTGTDTKLCVKFADIPQMACETTRYIGDRAQL